MKKNLRDKGNEGNWCKSLKIVGHDRLLMEEAYQMLGDAGRDIEHRTRKLL